MWEMRYVLFDCDNYSTLRQDTFKKIKTIDNTELDTRATFRFDKSAKNVNKWLQKQEKTFLIC